MLDFDGSLEVVFYNANGSKLYGVKGIPQNYLIDPSGKIVAANLRGEELHKKLMK